MAMYQYTKLDKLYYLDIFRQELGNEGRAIERFDKYIKEKDPSKETNFSRVTLWNWKKNPEIIKNEMTFANLVLDNDMKLVEDAETLLKGEAIKGNLKAICFLLKHKHPEYKQKIQTEIIDRTELEKHKESLRLLLEQATNEVDESTNTKDTNKEAGENN